MAKIDLLLISPSNWSLYPKGIRTTFLEPLGLEYIASQCVEKGFIVKILDMDQYKDIEDGNTCLLNMLDKYSPRYVGISVRSPLVNEAKRLVKQIRQKCKSKIFIGGAHVSALMINNKNLLDEIDADFYIGKEGERVVSEILQHDIVKDKFICGQQLDNIDKYVHPSRNLIDRSYLYLDYDFGVDKQVLASVITSRSCPYQCVFCASKTIFGNKLRLRGIQDIKSELEELKELGVNTLIFLDDTFTFNKQRTLEMCKVIGNLKFSYWLDTRVDAIDDDIMVALKDSGCKFIVFGVESGSMEILKVIKKGIAIDQIKKAFDIANKHKVATKANFMIGHPGETKKHVMETIDLAKNIPATKVSFYKVIPLPGTKLFEMIDDKEKISFTDFAWYKNPPVVSNMTNKEIDILQEEAYKAVKGREKYKKIY